MEGIPSSQRQPLADYFMNVAVVEKERLASPEKHESVLHHIPLILEQEVEAQRIIDRAVGAKVNPQIEGPRDDS